MRKVLISLILVLSSSIAFSSAPPPNPVVELNTSAGRIVLVLDAELAPQTVEHIVELVDAGFYDGLVFHRVIDGFMVQGGGFLPDLQPRDDEETIQNESRNGLSNRRGTIAMARTGDPHSASSQFFINVVDNERLDHRGSPGTMRWGYTVFGNVIQGMDVVDEIAATETGNMNGFSDVPVEPIVIESARRVD